MKYFHHLLMVVVFGLVIVGCPNIQTQLLDNIEAPITSQINSFSDNRCQPLAAALFDNDKQIATANDADAILVEFKILISNDGVK